MGTIACGAVEMAGSLGMFGALSRLPTSTSAAEQLEQDIARLRHQAQEKRQKAANLPREAANLEQTAVAELNSMPHPPPTSPAVR